MVTEPESEALRRYLPLDAPLITATFGRVEVIRHARRRDDNSERRARSVLARIRTLQLNSAMLEQAATLPPATLRTLDAIHIAAALTLREELDALVTYDARMGDAARSIGLAVAAPA